MVMLVNHSQSKRAYGNSLLSCGYFFPQEHDIVRLQLKLLKHKEGKVRQNYKYCIIYALRISFVWLKETINS